jgi:hypothetical protein
MSYQAIKLSLPFATVIIATLRETPLRVSDCCKLAAAAKAAVILGTTSTITTNT